MNMSIPDDVTNAPCLFSPGTCAGSQTGFHRQATPGTSAGAKRGVL